MASSEQYVLSSITSDDYPELAEISILSFQDNPLYYLTYPYSVSHKEIKSYLLRSMIKFDQEGHEVQTIKVMSNQVIVGFATWLLGPKLQNGKLERPTGANFKFLDGLKEKINQDAQKTYNRYTDFSKF